MNYLRKSWPVLVISIIWIIFASPFFLRGQLPFPSKYLVTAFAPWSTSFAMPVKSASMPDVITQIYPWKHISLESLKRGVVPLWNPYSFAGTMHAGNYQSAVFSPLNILYLLMDQKFAWGLAVLLQPLLAGFFMYMYLRVIRVSSYGSLLGALAFMFCGFMVVWMAYQTLGYAVLVLPLILFALEQSKNKKLWWALPLVSAGIGFSLVSGHFQMSLYICIFTAFYIYYLYIQNKDRILLTQRLTFLVLGVLLAAPQLLETMRSYTQSVRSDSFGKGEVIPWTYLVTLFAPDFFGHPVTRNDWFGHYAEWAGFVGTIPLLLSLFGIFTSEKKEKVFFAGSAVIALLLALPTVLNDLLYAAHIPVLSTSSASRIIIITSFSLAVLGAFGLDALMKRWEEKKDRVLYATLCTGLVFLGIFWFVMKFLHPLDPEKLIVATRNSLLSSVMLAVGLGAVVLGKYLKGRMRQGLVLIVLAFCAFDLFRFAAKWMPFEPAQYMYPTIPVVEQVRNLPTRATDRFIGNFGNEFTGMFGLSGLEGYDAVYKRRYGEFLSALSDGKIQSPNRSVALFDKRGIYTTKALDLLGITYYIHKVSDGRFAWAFPFWEYPYFESVWHDSTYELVKNNQAYPRAFLANAYTVITEPQQIIDTLFSDSFDRRHTVILEEVPKEQPQVGSGSAQILSYLPEKIVVQTQTDSPQILFISDSFDDGWKANVNGVKSPVYRANFAFRAVIVPKGESTVIMEYKPWSVRVGLYIALGALLGIGILIVKKRI